MNPYEANPLKIPPSDRYADVPLYGRYFPQPNDFKLDSDYINSATLESLQYWTSVLKKCDESNRIYDNQDGGRDVFALGTIIVKSSHLKATLEGRKAERDYSYADANEVRATDLARNALGGNVKVPRIYSPASADDTTKINGYDVLIQERVPGVGLNIAWQYISASQKTSFKSQARAILRTLRSVTPSTTGAPDGRSYVVPDHDPVHHRGIQDLERDIIFGEQNTDPDLGFMHNDFSLSNCIVADDKIVGLVDWEMAGFFGWKTAAAVHVQIRTPKRENFASLDLPEEMLEYILFWNDLYEGSEDYET